jgi:hypothetical protein
MRYRRDHFPALFGAFLRPAHRRRKHASAPASSSYVAEDGTTAYVAEDGTTLYVPES